MPTLKNKADDSVNSKRFDDVFRTELTDIRERHNRGNRQKIPDEIGSPLPTTALDLTGLACSGVGFGRRHSALVYFRASNRKISSDRWITCRRCPEGDMSAPH